MKFICKKSNLLTALQIVSKAVNSKSTMSILECILVDASNNKITFTANDMELGIETFIEGEVIKSGTIALDAKIFLDIIRKLPDGFITIETDELLSTSITCEKAKFKIKAKKGDDFTQIPEIEKNNAILISQFSLKEIIRQTIFSISDNDTNKIMTGELIEINENKLKIVSLDGHRISIRNIELKDKYENKKVIVPGKTLNEICKILNGTNDSDVYIYINEKHILFEFDNTIVVSRLIEGEFFPIDSMLSSDYETKVVINKKEFLNSIDRATLLVKEGDKKPIIMKINDSSIELKITSLLGNMKEEIDIEKNGKDMLIGFNPKFLIDALKVIDDEEITLYMVNPKSPCFIRDEENSYTYLVLPVNFVTVD